jgi:plastocyanin
MTTTTAPVTLPAAASRSLFDRKPFYTLVAAAGYVLIGLAGLTIVLLGLLAGDLSELGMFAVMMLVPSLLGAFLALKVGRWGFILPLLLVLGLLVMVGPFMPIALRYPQGGLEFILAALFVAGALLAVVGSVVSLIQWLRRAARPGATRGQRLALQAILALTALVVLASLLLTALARTTLSAEARAGAAPVAIKDFAFGEPLAVEAGQTVRLAVRNDDGALHTFTFDEAGIDVVIPAGAERLIEFTAPAAGTYTFYCLPHSSLTANGREGMVGTLTVAP